MKSLPQCYALLRLAVGWLGERDHSAWWNSSFLSTSGLSFSTYNFGRAPLLASWTATAAAAKRLHDDRIGRPRTFHLFRLPLAEEIRIHDAAAHDRGELLRGMKLSSDELMNFIEETARESIDAPVGPIQVGGLEDAFTDQGLRELAKHYLSAFQRGVQCFPYFSVGRT